MAKQFEVRYQAPGCQSGKTVQMNVYKPDDSLDATQSVTMTEIGTTGRYKGSFIADAPNWSVHVSDDAGGKQIKLFDKPAWDSHGVADLVADLQAAVDAVATVVDDIQTQVGSLTAPAVLG